MNGALGAPRAAIDIGSNTVRLLIYTEGNEGQLVRLKTLRAVTQLGKSLHSSGMIGKGALSASIEALCTLKGECTALGVREIDAIGTSALRDAENADFVVKSIRQETGISIEVVSGEREAHLTVLGMMNGVPRELSPDCSLLVDIGGGSTEWAAAYKGNYRKGSLPVGALGLYVKHVRHDPPLPEEISAMKMEIIQSIQTNIVVIIPPRGLIVTGGTASTLAAIDMKLGEYDGDRIHLHWVGYELVRRLHEEFVSMRRAARLSIVGLEAERADIIIAGNLIVMAFLEVFDLSGAIISDYGLLEGIAVQRTAFSENNGTC